MVKILPKWLFGRYAALWCETEGRPFNFDEAGSILNEKNNQQTNIALSSLARYGWLIVEFDRYDRRKRVYKLRNPEEVTRDIYENPGISYDIFKDIVIDVLTKNDSLSWPEIRVKGKLGNTIIVPNKKWVEQLKKEKGLERTVTLYKERFWSIRKTLGVEDKKKEIRVSNSKKQPPYFAR